MNKNNKFEIVTGLDETNDKFEVKIGFSSYELVTVLDSDAYQNFMSECKMHKGPLPFIKINDNDGDCYISPQHIQYIFVRKVNPNEQNNGRPKYNARPVLL